jgi:hypothetical protein
VAESDLFSRHTMWPDACCLGGAGIRDSGSWDVEAGPHPPAGEEIAVPSYWVA